MEEMSSGVVMETEVASPETGVMAGNERRPALERALLRDKDEKINKLETELVSVSDRYDKSQMELSDAQKKMDEMERRLALAKSELADAQESLKIHHNNSESFRLQRDSALLVQDSISNMIDTRNKEMTCMKQTIDESHLQLEKAVNVKCELLTKSKGIQSKSISNYYTELHSEHSKAGRVDQIEMLKNELSRCSGDLLNVQGNLASMKVEFERQLSRKNDELNVCNVKITKLNQVKDGLNAKVEALNKKLTQNSEKENKINEEYNIELISKTKIIDLYKSNRANADAKNDELTSVITELRQLLNESNDKYEELELNYKRANLEHKEMSDKKCETIVSLKRELENANDLLQMTDSENLSAAMEDLSPSAAIASRFIKSRMSLTQAYDQLIQLSEELTTEKGENKRLTHAINTIVHELEEKAPFIEQQKVHSEETAEMNAILTQRLDSVVLEYGQLRDENVETLKQSMHYQKENAQLKVEIDDLSHQICFLLKESETRKGRYFPHDRNNTSTTNDMNSSQIITEKLVTFGDIKDLQSNNQKLLKLVRNLSEKNEEKDQIKDQMESEDVELKLETLKSRITELTEAQNRQVKMINELIQQRDAYKKMSNDQNLDGSVKCDDSLDVQKNNDKFQCLEILESQLDDVKKELQEEKEQHRMFVEQAKTNELKLVQMHETVHKQLNELHSKYIKCLSTSNGLTEKCKVLQINLSTSNREAIVLSGKINSYANMMKKQESFNKKIHDELSVSRNKLTHGETLINSLQAEHTKMLSLTKRLHGELRNQNLGKKEYSNAVKNIESIKSSIENSDSESVVKIQSTLEEANITYSTLRCMLQLEQSKYRDLTSYLNDEMEQYKHKIDSEQGAVENLKIELAEVKEELMSKAILIKELNCQLSFNSKSINTVDATGKIKSSDDCDDVQVLKQQLEISRGHIEKYCNIYESSERDLKALNETFNEYKQTTEAQIASSLKQEECLKAKCQNLEEQLATSFVDVKSTQDKLNSMSVELADRSSSLSKALLDCALMSESVQTTEEKYAYEIILHSNDIQALTQMKEQLINANQQTGEMERVKLELESILKEKKDAWESREKMLSQENADVKDQLQDINKQNAALHDRIQSLSSKLTLTHTSKASDISGDVSVADNTLNYSLDEVESKSSEQLLQIIKYLRKEKDILMTKFEIMQVENQRIKSQLETTETQLDDVKLTSSTDKNQREIVSAKHSGVIRKVETLNAMSDCFVDLRKERDILHAEVQEMTKKYTELSNSIVHLQESNSELSAKISLLQTENSNYRTEVTKWKHMANALIEKDDTTSTDDFKKLQNERETLLMSLAAEKDNVKKLSDEIAKLTVEKNQYGSQVDNLCKQQSILSENLKKKINELTVVKRDFDKMNQELSEAKSVATEKTKEVLDLSVKSTADDATITDIRTKEAQVRKIGKRYKTQYEELLKAVDEEKKKSAALVTEAAVTSENHLETCKILEQKSINMEKNLMEKLSDLKTQISSSTDENKTLQKEIDSLKNSHQDMEEKMKQLLKQAKAKMMLLNDAKDKLTTELNDSKAKLDTFEQNKDENEVRLSLLKSQYDGRVAKLEKERTQLLQEKQAEIVQLNKQIELLTVKINQLQKKIDIQQSPKPSTSGNQGEKCTSEPPTANIKPMAGVSQRDTNRRVSGETPLASIRPMASHSGVRTAAVLPTTAQQTTHSLIQAPHTTGSISGDMLSSSSGSIGIEYLPSSSSPGSRIHPQHSRHVTLPPPESTQDTDTDVCTVGGETSSVGANAPSVPQSMSASQLGSQAVALVMPRMETTAADLQTLHPHQQQASSSSNNNSSSTVTTSHGPASGNSGLANKGELLRAFKRPRVLSNHPQQKTILKRLKIQGFQRVTENEADYQMPTSSQRDQEDEMVGFGDSDDEESYQDPMYDEDEENDIEDKERPATETRTDLNIAEEQEATGSNNEVDLVDDSSQEVRSSHHEDVGSRRCDEIPTGNIPTLSTLVNPIQEQQIETISSGTGVTSAAVRTYEEADDSIVPVRNDSENTTAGGVTADAQEVAPQLVPNDASIQGVPSINVTAQSSEAEVGGSLSSRSSNSMIDDESPTVSSQSTPSSFVPQVEEGREAEASSTGSNNTIAGIRGLWRGSRTMNRRASMSPQVHQLNVQRAQDQRPSPIVWNSDVNMRRGFIPQRGMPRGGRHVMRRPPNFYKRF